MARKNTESLAAFHILTVTADAGSSGSVRRLAPSGDTTTNYAPTAVAAITSLVLGPFTANRSYEILSDTGKLTSEITEADIQAADVTEIVTDLGYTPEDVANKSTNVTTDGASDTKYPSAKAVKTYADSLVVGLLDFKGVIDASTNPNYSAASKGDSYVISVAGKVGGSSGKTVDVGDFVIATADNAGGTEASVGTSWIVLEHNILALGTAAFAATTAFDAAGAAATAQSNAIAGSGKRAFTIVSADGTTAAAGDRIQADTTGGTLTTITLPASATAGDTIQIEDSAGTWDTHNLTVARNSLKINGGTSDYTASTAGGKLSIVYISAGFGWSIK